MVVVEDNIAPKHHIVNDNAERGVSFMQEVNALVTKDEEQTQCAIYKS